MVRQFPIRLALTIAGVAIAVSAAWADILPDGTVSSSSGPNIVSGVTGPQAKAIFERFGQDMTLETDSDGDPKLVGRVEGVKFEVLFYGCDKADARRCVSYQYYLGFNDMKDVTVAMMNDWDSRKRFASASRHKNGTIELRMNVNIEGGVTEENLKNWHGWWKVAVKGFKEHINYK